MQLFNEGVVHKVELSPLLKRNACDCQGHVTATVQCSSGILQRPRQGDLPRILNLDTLFECRGSPSGY